MSLLSAARACLDACSLALAGLLAARRPEPVPVPVAVGVRVGARRPGDRRF